MLYISSYNLDKEFKALEQTFRIYHPNTILWDKSGSSLIWHLIPVLNRTIVDAICKSFNKEYLTKFVSLFIPIFFNYLINR